MPVISTHWVLGKSLVQQLLTDTWNMVGTIYCVKTSFSLSSSQLTECKFCSDSLASRKVGSSQSRHPTLLATHKNGHMSHPCSSWDHPPGHRDESKWASESRYVSYLIQVAIMEYQRLGGLKAVFLILLEVGKSNRSGESLLLHSYMVASLLDRREKGVPWCSVISCMRTPPLPKCPTS